MITTKGQARFHEGGFASNPNNATNIAFGAAASIASHHPHPHGLGLVAPQGTKRLASCREELELSWTSSGLSSSSSSSSQEFYTDLNGNMGGNCKRRRTMGTSSWEGSYTAINNKDSMMESSDDSAIPPQTVVGIRITPTNRPMKVVNGNINNNSIHNTTDAASSPIKAGWYQGQVDPLGNRHGAGITKHDDGTEYEGHYHNDVMEGMGRYKFVSLRQMVPNPSLPPLSHAIVSHTHNHAQLHRQIERSFEGVFKNDNPNGMGILITKTVDSTPPQGTSSSGQGWASAAHNHLVKFVQVTYDVGYHKADGSAVGEGVRFIYSKSQVENRSTWEQSFYRLINGQCTTVQVAREYAVWLCTCLGVEAPTIPEF